MITPAGVLDLGRAPESAAGPGPAPVARRVRGRVRRHHGGALRVHPVPEATPLRGVVVPGLRDRRRRAAGRHPDRYRRHRHPAVRRGRDRRQPGHHRAHRRAADHRRLPGDHRVRGHRRHTREPARRDAGGARGPRRHVAGRGAGPGVGARPVRRAVPARLAAGRGRAVRDPGDGDELVQHRRAESRRHRGADRPRWPNPARPPLCCATFRTCIRPARRCTSPSSPGSAATRSSSGARRRPRRRTR